MIVAFVGGSVLPQAVLRGDYGQTVIGEESNVQDGAVIHATATLDSVVRARSHRGDSTTSSAARGKLRAVRGGLVVVHRALVGSRATLGAWVVVTNHTKVPPATLAVGLPPGSRVGSDGPT